MLKHWMLRFTVLTSLSVAMPAWGGDEEAAATPEASPLHHGFYLAPMASYVKPYSNRDLDDGYGGTLGLGYRFGALAVELEGEYAKFDPENEGPKSKITSGHVGVLWFPFDLGLYGVGAAGRTRIQDQPRGSLTFESDSFEAGLGYVVPISLGAYEFGIRVEARERFSERKRAIAAGDDNLPRRYHDTLVNLGLQLPFGLKQPPQPPAAAPVAVVPPAAACSDGTDNDGDGKVDFPADPGCSSADDQDETDPPACSDGHDNDGDGKIDHPSDPGCSAADDQDEADPCKAPLAGERVSLKGCGTGDVIVLRGVNFEFDQSRLTANAKTILDNVAEELTAYPDISVEIGGYTDAKGTDSYNQHLSEQRAASVVRYLSGKGIGEGRMTSTGYGEGMPVADNETDEGRELNRRVELKITAAATSADRR